MRCEPAHFFTVAKARAWRSAIDDDPPYQRRGDAWTLAQRQRFLDSLLNGYDVPKLYLHDLRGQHPTRVYGVVDGKQRLTAIWSFLADGFGLAEDFRVAGRAGSGPGSGDDPSGGLRFSELAPAWQARLLGTYLSVVLIRDADEADIDELFARLNGGTPLSSAEARNAIAGEMSALVRAVAALPALRSLLPFADLRGAHREVAAALLALEDASQRGASAEPDLGPSALDAFVRVRGREIGGEARTALLEGVERRLLAAGGRLGPDDPRLANATSAIEALRGAWAPPAGASRPG